MARVSISTRDLAALLGVTETTIKRWADDGAIRCTKTLGGHRKFLLKDVVAFAEENDYTLPGILPPEGPRREAEQLEFNLQTGNYPKIADLVREKALDGNTEALVSLFLHFTKHHLGIPLIADEIFRPAMCRMGEMWKRGELDVSREHIASNAILQSIVRVAPELHCKPPNGKSAVVACTEGDLHEIGLRLLASAFETDGWQVRYIGPNTPFDTLRSFVKTEETDLLMLSATMHTRKDWLVREMQSLGKICASRRIIFVCGGSFAAGFKPADLGCDYIASSVSDALHYVRDRLSLKPGPKITRAPELLPLAHRKGNAKWG